MMMQDPNPLRRGPGIGQIKEIQLNEDGKFDFNFDIVLGENEIAELSEEIKGRKEAIEAVEEAAKADTAERKQEHAELTATVSENHDAINDSLKAFQVEVDEDFTSQEATIKANAEEAAKALADATEELDSTIKANAEDAAKALADAKAELETKDAQNRSELDASVKTVDDRVSAILDGAEVDWDTLKELNDAYNLADTEIIDSITSLDTKVSENHDAINDSLKAFMDETADGQADQDKAIKANAEEAAQSLKDAKDELETADAQNREEVDSAISDLSDTVSANHDEVNDTIKAFKVEVDEEQDSQDAIIKANAEEAAQALADAKADLEGSISDLTDTVEANAGAGVQNTDYRHSTGEFEAVEGEAYSFSVEGKVETSTAILFVNGIQTNVDACNYDEEGGETVVSFTPVATDSGAVYTLFGVNFS